MFLVRNWSCIRGGMLISGRYHFSCLFKLQKILISKHFSLHRTYLFPISAFCWHNFLFLPAGSVYEMIHQVVSASPSSPSAASGIPGELWAAGFSLSPAIVEDLGLVPSTHMVPHYHLELQFQGIWCILKTQAGAQLCFPRPSLTSHARPGAATWSQESPYISVFG